MTRPIKAAAVRIANDPAPTLERLETAEVQVIRAAEQGAQLVVLPELFNTGYVYSDDNYARAETLDGTTVAWMKRVAAEHNIHLAGSLLLLGAEDITNSLLLVAPDGRLWRYDKAFPWVWERLYFREGRDITLAETDIGTFGLMICADVGSPRLFKRYAGRVDALIIATSPARVHEMETTFPDGARITARAVLPEKMRDTVEAFFDGNVRRFAAWMGVPVVQSVPHGRFASGIPVPWLSFGLLLAFKPSLWKYIPQGRRAVATAPFFEHNQIIDAAGNVAARYADDADGFALADIALADERPQPQGKAPALRMPPYNLFNGLLVPFYRRRVRRAWGPHMAPVDEATRTWRWIVGLAFVLGLITGWRGDKAHQDYEAQHPEDADESPPA